MISHIKYTLIFDERVDRKELDAIFENDNGDKHLMEEIVAEDQICEVMAKNELQKRDKSEDSSKIKQAACLGHEERGESDQSFD